MKSDSAQDVTNVYAVLSVSLDDGFHQLNLHRGIFPRVVIELSVRLRVSYVP
jgi:hypothetical protein